MLLLHRVLTIRPEQTKTNIRIDIDVPQDFDRLEIDASYSPKRITDPETVRRLTLEGSLKFGLLPPGTDSIPIEDCPELCNMVTLSLDINDRFCGYAHRHDPVQHIVVSESEATPGFHKMRPEKGVWHLVIPVNMVAGGDCRYELTVKGVMNEK